MKQIGTLIREIVPVIIGILAALVINNWNEERKDRAYLNKIYSSIEMEFEESKEEIERVVPKQMALLDTIAFYMDKEDVTLMDVVWKGDGLQQPEIKVNAWRAIAGSKIELMEYGKISALSDIEERKENLNKRTEKMADFILLNLEDTSPGKKKLLRMMMVDIINAENRLQAVIEDLLEE